MPTAMQLQLLTRCSDRERPFLPVRRETSKYMRLVDRGWLKVSVANGDGWQRCGFVLTGEGEVAMALAERDGK